MTSVHMSIDSSVSCFFLESKVYSISFCYILLIDLSFGDLEIDTM